MVISPIPADDANAVRQLQAVHFFEISVELLHRGSPLRALSLEIVANYEAVLLIEVILFEAASRGRASHYVSVTAAHRLNAC
jgi:hypothetical protein